MPTLEMVFVPVRSGFLGRSQYPIQIDPITGLIIPSRLGNAGLFYSAYTLVTLGPIFHAIFHVASTLQPRDNVK
jgi:hypothetical protein